MSFVFRMLNVIKHCMHIIINQLIIQRTLNKHFTWHLLILCSCMSFCCLTRMHEFFFYKGLPFLWVNQRVDISSSSILAFQNFLVTLYLARSFLVTMPTTWWCLSTTTRCLRPSARNSLKILGNKALSVTQ